MWWHITTTSPRWRLWLWKESVLERSASSNYILLQSSETFLIFFLLLGVDFLRVHSLVVFIFLLLNMFWMLNIPMWLWGVVNFQLPHIRKHLAGVLFLLVNFASLHHFSFLINCSSPSGLSVSSGKVPHLKHVQSFPVLQQHCPCPYSWQTEHESLWEPQLCPPIAVGFLGI